MVKFITGQAGSGKTTLMLEKIKENSEKSNTQLIIVPEQYSYEFDKKLYFFIGAEKFNELFSLSFTSLSRQLFQLYGEPGRKGEYADDYARMILIYQAISAVQDSPDALNYFSRQSSQNGFAEEVLELINDMKRSGITPGMLMKKSVFFERRLMDKTNDIASIYLEYDRLMEEYGFKDNLENIVKAAETANREKWFKGMNIYIDEFESFSGDQLQMIKVMISFAENVYITLRTDNVNAGEFTLFETVNHTYRTIKEMCRDMHIECSNIKCEKSYRFKSPDLEYISTHIMRNFRYTPENTPVPENIRIFEAKDMYSETEYVCATIKRLMYENKSLKYHDFAVISNNIAEYTDILKSAFERCEIPYFLSMEKPVVHTSIMVFFSSLLDLLTARKINSENIFRFMKCGILNISLTDISLFEDYCYKWNVDGDTWCSPFTAEDENLERLEEIRVSVINPVMNLKKRLSRKNTAENICRMLYEYLVECDAEKSMSRLMGKLIKLDRDYEATEMKRLWGCLMDILDSISETLGEKIISLSEISRIIRSMIGKLEYSSPPQTLDSVIAASSRTARLGSPKVVFAIGSNDGDFPNQVNIHGIFSESDKQKLSQSGIEISRSVSELTASERLVVYKALSSASEKLFVTYPLSDLSGQSKYPAPAVDSIIRIFGDESIRLTRDDISLDYYAVTLHSAFYHYMQNRSENNVYTASIKKILMNEPDYSRRLSYVTDRSEHRQDYKIERDVVKKLKPFTPLRLSSTDIETYNTCHFRYFCERCMKIKSHGKMELDARIAGEIIHECFCIILKQMTKEEFLNMSYDELKNKIRECAEKYRKEKLAGDFGKNGKFELIFNKLIERLIAVFVHTQNELRVTSFTPHAFEVNLNERNPVVLPFGDGYKLVFGGIIDRVDTCTIDDNKYVRIIDYKSSKKFITPETLGSGINLQMLLYLFASTDEDGIYDGFIPSGVLYSPVQIAENEVKTDDMKDDSENIGVINSSLKASGLVLSDYKVLYAMEENIKGNFIPVKMNKDGEMSKRQNSCITSEGMKQLRKFAYKKLSEMAESLLEGDAEALPLLTGKYLPCENCDYINICDNSLMKRYRTPDEKSMAEAEEILNHKTEEKEDNS